MNGLEDKKYFIFSDESGSWSNPKCKFYIRSWIKIEEKQYLYFKGLWSQRKLPYPTYQSLLKNSNEIADILKNDNFKYFFTITKLNEFYLRKWGIRDSVSLALSQLENILLKEYEKKIPPKLKTALNQVLFLNVYEKVHIENAMEYLLEKNGVFYEFYINKPQFSEDDYLEIFDNAKNKFKINAKIQFITNKENELGVSFADAISSIFYKSLLEENRDCINLLKNNIFPYSVVGGMGIKGINKVFYPVNRSYGRDDLQKEEKEFIDNIRNIFG